MSVTDWIRLFRLRDVRSLLAACRAIFAVRRRPPLVGGFLAEGTAESSRLLSLPDGKESQMPLLEPMRAFSGRMRNYYSGSRVAYIRLNGAEVAVAVHAPAL